MTKAPEEDPYTTPATPYINRPRRELLKMIRTLHVTAGPDMLKFVTIGDGQSVEIGRGSECALALRDASVSRKHARVTAGDEGVTVEDLESTNGTALNGQTVMRAPLRAGDRVDIGSVPLRFDILSSDEVDHMRTVAERLESRDRDPLTGLLTRVWFDEGLPEMLAQADQTATPAACLFFDIDHFKRINDGHGHGVGDDVLAQAARLVMFSVRDRDVCVRYGGEEILVVLEGSSESRAAIAGEHVRRAIESHNWSHVAAGLSVTISCGVAARNAGEPAKDWFARADRALYAAKHGGRNQVRRASDIAST